MQVTKIYCISTDDVEVFHGDLTDEQFISEAERHGDTYSLEDFAKAFNDGDVNTNTDVIRIITTDIPNPMHVRLLEDVNRQLNTVDQHIKEGKDKSFTIGYMIAALTNVKNNLSQ